MSTVLIVIGLIVVFVIVVALVLYIGPGRGSGHGGLKRRFGPEYDRAVARHEGDTSAAEHELKERVRRHGDLEVLPLAPEQREAYVARWTGLQERFVDEPRDAVRQAEELVARLAGERGFPAADADGYEEHLDALSVHHAHHLDGYRRMHVAASRGTGEGAGDDGASTEELREAMVGARELFEQLILAGPEDGGPHGRGTGPAGRKTTLSMRPKGSSAS